MLTEPTRAFLEDLEHAHPGLIAPLTDAWLEEPRGISKGRAAALLRPRSTEEVAEIVRRANAARVGLVPRSGGTGLVGGQVREDDPPCVLVSLDRMSAVRDLDPVDQTMVVEAGAILADIHAAAEVHGLTFPLSLGSEGTCRIGGNLSTNAGGVNVIRYGNTRELCLGVEAVLGDGTVLRGLKALRKDNTGYDLRHLLIGAEGTLGIITAARLKLVPIPPVRLTALLEVESPAAALRLLRKLQARFAETVSAFELIDGTGISFLREMLPELTLPPVGTAPWYVLTEIGSGEPVDEPFMAVLEAAMDAGEVTDGQIAQSEAQRATMWHMRESIPEGNRRVGAVASHDISVPIARVPEYIDVTRRRITELDPELRINCFGHLGDGNLHYNIFPARGRSRADYANIRKTVTGIVHDTVADFDGSISAEHGIGRFKKDDLAKYGDPGKLAAMRAIKSALDPNGIMNPGAVLDI